MAKHTGEINSLLNKMSPSEAVENLCMHVIEQLHTHGVNTENYSVLYMFDIPIMAALPSTLQDRICISTEAVCVFIVVKTVFFTSSFTTWSINCTKIV